MGKRAGEAAMLRDALSHDTDDSASAETERIERKLRKKRKKSEEEVAGASKQQRREKDSGKNGKKKPTKPSEELLAELKDFSEDSIKRFMLWEQEQRDKQQFGAKKSVDPAPPSAPCGRGRHNLPKKRKKTMSKDEDIDDDKVREVQRRTITPKTMKRHTRARARAHTRTLAHARTHTTHAHAG